MSAATLTRPSAGPTSKFIVTFPRLLRSELIKFLTVRSTLWSLSVAVVLVIGFGAIMASASKSQDAFGDGVSVGAMAPIVGVYFAQLVYVVLGVIGIGSEYSTGMIRSTLSAAPTRTPALLAKTVVLGIASFVVSFVSIVVAFFLVQAILSSTDHAASLGDPHVLRMLVGAALYLSFMTMFSLSIGAIVRNTAAGISIVVGLLLILPTFLPIIPWKPLKEIVKYLPGVGDAVMLPPGQSTHTAWVGFAILAAWTVVGTIVAAVLLKRRDA
ncbi:ABC-2 type transport system permease protein [Sanguibacter gelidistatuariae]|uniref:ABC-2 type transport system permease protein n=1 Tax=Sanguibacter gelidistatuariae TaxID=1814289 RepID=A0A1G6QGZ0_9MICO|nr:ABC transporter permease subunit [Sanguibacter gelidistatuariae]SDC91421.1 ABC-2 type transport system permease protein [Sanguibacter gelidistatuariae]